MSQDFATLGDMAELHNERRMDHDVPQTTESVGRYLYYDQREPSRFVEDYTSDGDILLIGSIYDVCTPEGGIETTRISGKNSISSHYHVLTAHDAEELDYLEVVLRYTRAKPFLENNPFIDIIDEAKVLDIKVRWPEDARDRRSFIEAVRRVNALRENLSRERRLCLEVARARFGDMLEIESSVNAELGLAAELRPGRPMAELSIAAVAGYPFYNALGERGSAESWFVPPKSIQACASNGRVALHWMQTRSWAIDSLSFIQGSSDMPASYLYFALDSVKDVRCPEGLATAMVPLVSKTARSSFSDLADSLLLRMHQIDSELKSIHDVELALLWAFGNGDYPAGRLSSVLDKI